jgi:hypothetical protein
MSFASRAKFTNDGAQTADAEGLTPLQRQIIKLLGLSPADHGR